MTDDRSQLRTRPSTPMPARRKRASRRGFSESIHAADKAALFDALARTGITIVTVRFDGCWR